MEGQNELPPDYFGGSRRHNRLYRQTLNPVEEVLCEELMVENHAIILSSGFLPEGKE